MYNNILHTTGGDIDELSRVESGRWRIGLGGG